MKTDLIRSKQCQRFLKKIYSKKDYYKYLNKMLNKFSVEELQKIQNDLGYDVDTRLFASAAIEAKRTDEREDSSEYRKIQIEKVQDENLEGNAKVKIQSIKGKETKWLNISWSELCNIKNILTIEPFKIGKFYKGKE